MLNVNNPAVNLEFLDSEEMVLAFPLHHPLARLTDDEGSGSISLSDLKRFSGDSWMMTNHDSMLRNLTDAIFDMAGFFPEKVLLETSSTNAHIAAIEEGIAVSLVPLPTRKIMSRMRILHLEPRQHRSLYVAYRKSYLLSESQRFFISKVREFYECHCRTFP